MPGSIALLVAIASLVATPTAGTAVATQVPVSGTTPFPPACNGAPAPPTSVEYRSAEVEPWIDADPTTGDRLLATWQQDRYSDGGANGLGMGVSRDGGQSWSRVPLSELPGFSRCQGAAAGSDGDYERASDPWVSFGPDGDAYGVSLSFNRARDAASAILASASRDGGATWGPVRVIRRDGSAVAFNDKESVTADQTDARYVYVVWDRIENFPDSSYRAPTWFARTMDGGVTWEAARAIFDPGADDGTVGNQIVVTPDGSLVNGYSLVKDGRRSVAVIRSIDKGASWAPQVVVGSHETVGVRDPRTAESVRTGDIIPALAADERAGASAVYMVWQDARFSGGAWDQIVLSRSADGGATWSPPRPISKVASTQAFTPAVRVDAAGNLGVTYYDFRFDTQASGPLETDVWFLRSADGGQTFTEERLTPASFDMRAAPVARGFFVGDYTGLAAVGQTFKALFALAGAGGTDVFSSTISPPSPGPPTPVAPPQGPLAAPPPSRAKPPAAVRVGRNGRLGRRFASLTLRCLTPPCRGQVELSAVLRTGGRRRPVILGSRGFRLGRGRLTLRVPLNRRARRLTSTRKTVAGLARITLRGDRVDARVRLRRRR